MFIRSYKVLEKVLCLPIRGCVVLHANLTTHNRVINGAMGTIADIVYASDSKSPTDIPLVDS